MKRIIKAVLNLVSFFSRPTKDSGTPTPATDSSADTLRAPTPNRSTKYPNQLTEYTEQLRRSGHLDDGMMSLQKGVFWQTGGHGTWG